MSDQEEDHQNIELKNDSVQGFFSHHEPVYSIDINPIDENIIISGGGDDKSYLWRVDTGKQLFELSGHTDSVTSVIFSTDGQYVASGGMDGKVLVWKVGTGELVISLEGPDEIMWLSWHPKGNILLAGANDSTIWMWQIPKGNVMNVFAGHSSPVTAGQFTPDGKKIVSGSDDSTLIVWDPKSATATSRISGEDARFHNEGITSLAVNKDSSLVITGSTDKSAKLLNILNGNILGSFENHTDSVEAVGFSNSLPLAATGSLDNSLNIWDLNTFRLRQTSHHEDAITKLKWHDASSSSPHLITTSSVDHTVRVWDARTGDCVRVFSGHQDSVLDVGVSRDGRTIVSGGDDGACLLFKL
ncbi:5597_t:CDS:10 [Ambispora leptoticha]|uniref:5597_t:CDS:1 n=1 Tax=Ambispora leptoticha TaxID=144679 RepID=A0A9N9EEN1_9GLOM|nr:5597_t:CDS:10 [Ambispora leptoticha]